MRTRLLCAMVLAALSLGLACVPMVQGFANNKTPAAQTAQSCAAWECWDGYKCGECPADAKSNEKPK